MRVFFAIAQFGLVSLIFPFAVCMQMLDDMSFGFLWDTLWKAMCILVVAAGFWCGRFVTSKPIAGARRFQPLRNHFLILLSVPVGILLWSLICLHALFACCAADLCGQYELGESIYHRIKITGSFDKSVNDNSMADWFAKEPAEYAPALAALVKEYGASSPECIWFKNNRCDYYYHKDLVYVY